MPRRKKKNTVAKNETRTSVKEECVEEEEWLGDARSTCQLKKSPQVGRYLVARKRLVAGDKVLEDEALVVGPCQDTKIVCIGCCMVLDVDQKSFHRCSGCGWPICGGGCNGLSTTGPNIGKHTAAECQLFQIYFSPTGSETGKVKFSPLCFNMVTPIRCLLLRDEQPDTWEKIIRMESHNEIRREIPRIWTKNQMCVVEPIRKLAPEFSEELIHTICGILEVNCFSVGAEGVEARALYPRAYLLQHDCVPNTTHIDQQNFNMIFRASVQIRAGAPITLAYVSTLNGTLKRREELKSSKFFDCCCERCSSSTELGTYLSSIKCPSCHFGATSPTDPLTAESNWKCDKCEEIVPSILPVAITRESIKDLENIVNPTVTDYEELLSKYENILHKNHSTMIKLRYTLSQMYGKAIGYLLNNMSEEMLRKKYDMCRQLLKVFDIIEPGVTRIRGVTMYECHAPLLLLTQVGYMNGKVNKKEAKREVNRVREMLEECVKILSLETPDSPEGQICKAAYEALQHPGLCF